MTVTPERVTAPISLCPQRVSGEQSVNSAEAEEFLDRMFAEGAAEEGDRFETRLAQVRAEIAETGTYPGSRQSRWVAPTGRLSRS
jgi:nitric-oxide synthase